MAQRKNSYFTYDNTGWPAPGSIIHAQGDTHILAPPGTGKHYVILGLSCEHLANIRDDATGSTSSGTIRACIPGDSDGLRFPCALAMADNMGVYIETSSAGSDLTLFYYLVDDTLV